MAGPEKLEPQNRFSIRDLLNEDFDFYNYTDAVQRGIIKEDGDVENNVQLCVLIALLLTEKDLAPNTIGKKLGMNKVFFEKNRLTKPEGRDAFIQKYANEEILKEVGVTDAVRNHIELAASRLAMQYQDSKWSGNNNV